MPHPTLVGVGSTQHGQPIPSMDNAEELHWCEIPIANPAPVQCAAKTQCMPSSSLQVVGMCTTSDLSSSSTEVPCPRMFQRSPQPTAAATYAANYTLGTCLRQAQTSLGLVHAWLRGPRSRRLPRHTLLSIQLGLVPIRLRGPWDLSTHGPEVPAAEGCRSMRCYLLYAPGTCPH